MTEVKSNRGGRREGAGRPASGNKSYGYSVNPRDLAFLAHIGGSTAVRHLIAADDITPDYTLMKTHAGAFTTVRMPPELHDIVKARGGAAYIRDLLARTRLGMRWEDGSYHATAQKGGE